MKLKKILAIVLLTISMTFLAKAQENATTPTPEELNDRVNGIDERLTEAQNDLSILKKIKVSGYLQAQFEKSEKASGLGLDPYDNKDAVQSRFRIRRSRLKFTYDAGLTQFVVQGDFSNTGFALKDAYLNITDPWLKEFGLKVGVFNRPNYEVEYSSSQRESVERSKVITTLYPNERDLGAMLTYHPEGLFKLQLAAFNNTFGGPIAQTMPTFRDEPLYFMARVTTSLKVTDELGIDFGVHGRFGSVRSNSPIIINSDLPSKTTSYDSSASNYGSSVSRSWFGGEAQIYWDFLGGTKILAEYLSGSDLNELSLSSVNPAKAVRKRDFSGFYIMLVKNITKEWQLAAKYDSYNPNTKLDHSKVDVASELTTNTYGFGIHNYSFSNVRITLWYDMPITETNGTILTEDPKDNLLTLRFQYKF